MNTSVKISLEWKLITDPELLGYAKALISSNAGFAFSQSLKKDDNDWGETRITLGDDFNRIYAFPIHEVEKAILNNVQNTIEEMIDTVLTDQEYSNPLQDSIARNLDRRFGNLASFLMGEDEGAPDNLWITTFKALCIAGFTFNEDKTIATPPPRPKGLGES